MLTLEEAQDIYRTAWHNYLLTRDEDVREVHSNIMDGVQRYYVSEGRPGTEWEAFVDTLPGFREHWETWGEEMKKKLGEEDRNEAS